jgi:tight adherence protein C
MNLSLLLIALSLLLGLFFLFFYLFPLSSAGSIRLEKVTREALAEGKKQGGPQWWGSLLSAEELAKPFALIRGMMSGGPDEDLTRRLMLAGYRKPAHADLFVGAKLALPAALGFAAALLGGDNVIVFFFLALVVGFFAPDFWLSHAVNSRRERIRLSLPDGLDLLSICLEAGLGLDQAIVRIAQELHTSHPDLSEELLQVNFEQRAGAPRLAAWKAFSDRVNFESARSFVAMLIQTDRFGTPISKSLGTFADALRTQRRQQAEEMAAKTTIKLVVPLVLFIFPDVFIVVVGPAVITIMRSFAHILG